MVFYFFLIYFFKILIVESTIYAPPPLTSSSPSLPPCPQAFLVGGIFRKLFSRKLVLGCDFQETTTNLYTEPLFLPSVSRSLTLAHSSFPGTLAVIVVTHRAEGETEAPEA